MSLLNSSLVEGAFRRTILIKFSQTISSWVNKLLIRKGLVLTIVYFLQALTASDLNIVMYVCQNVDPENVFSQSPCPLSQPVLLSLIQQLSVDLTMDTELKQK